MGNPPIPPAGGGIYNSKKKKYQQQKKTTFVHTPIKQSYIVRWVVADTFSKAICKMKVEN